MSVLVIVILAIFAVCAILGLSRGLFNIIFALATLIVSIMAIVLLAPNVETYLKEKTNMYERLNQTVYDTLDANEDVNRAADEAIENAATAGIEGKTSKSLGTYVAEELAKIPFAGTSTQSIANSVNTYVDQTETALKAAVIAAIAANVTATVFRLLCYVLVYFAAMALMKVIRAIVSLFLKNKLLSGVNRVLGLIFGLLEALLITWLILFVITSAVSDNSALMQDINNNVFVKILYDTDILRIWAGK